MSVWNHIVSLPEDQQRQLFSIYNNNNIPIEIRMQLAEWIEEQNWPYYVENNSEALSMHKCQLINQFSIKIKNLIEMTDDVAYRYKLNNYLSMINNSTDVNGIIKNIYDCLNYEKEFIRCHQEEMPLPQTDNYFNNFQKLGQMNDIVKNNIIQAENTLKNIKSIKETFNIKQVEFSCYEIPNNNDTNAIAMQKKLLETMNYLRAECQTNMNELINRYGDVILKLQETSSVLFEELNTWKQHQKNKTDSSENLLQIKNQSEFLATNICNLWQQLKCIDAIISTDSNEDLMNISQFIEIKKQTTQLFKNLISETFIVKVQPKQVIKKETKFNATVTLLVGSVLNVHLNSLLVRVQIINEEQAKLWYSEREKFLLNSCCGEIVNNTTIMEYNSVSNTLSANFINLRLKSIKRAEKKASIDKVVDEKFALMFTTEIFLENDIKFVISTISVPVVVIVHGNQKIHALSTIIWDNSFSEVKRCPFNVPTEVKLDDLAQVLSKLFFDYSKRHLSEENIHFLAEKIIGYEIEKQQYYNTFVSLTKFSKDLLPEQSFSFWDWFYNILQLTREHLSDIWADGHIIGFLPRQHAETLLLTKPPGTFLLRFSDTLIGGISVAYRNANNKVECLVPFVSNDLKIRKLADRLNDFNQFMYLYPDIPKDKALSKYYTRLENPASNGYVLTQLKNCIPSEREKESSFANFNEQGNILNSNGSGVPVGNMVAVASPTSMNNITEVMSYDVSPYGWNRNPSIDEQPINNEYNFVPIINDSI